MDPELREKIALELVERGVPRYVADDVLAFGYRPGLHAWAHAAMLLVTVVGFAITGFAFHRLGQLNAAYALEDARAQGAVLYHANFGVSMMPLFLSSIVWSNWILRAMVLRSARWRALIFTSVVLAPASGLQRMSIQRAISQAAFANGTDAYLRRWWTVDDQVLGWIGGTLLGLTLLLLPMDLRAHSVFTPTYWDGTPFLPWRESPRRYWRDAVSVEIACDHLTGKYAHDSLHYDIAFADGESTCMDCVQRVGALDELDGLEAIDAEIRRSRATIVRSAPVGRNPLHSECLEAMRSRYGPAYARIERLLRIDGGAAP